MITTSYSSLPQSSDTQSMINSLENTLLDRERNEWYTVNRFKWSKLREYSEKALSQIFFPVEVLDVYKRDASCEEVAREVLLDNAGVYEGENEAVSVYLFCCNLDPTTFSTGTFFHVRFTRSFTGAIRAFASRADTKVLLQLRKELRKMDLTFFLSHKMMKDYFEKYCPILNSILSKWKLVRELEEVARDERF